MRATMNRVRASGAERMPAAVSSGAGPPLAVGMVITAIVALSLAGCASRPGSDADEWSAAYVANPDRVWAAIHQTLEELGYEVDEESRLDGTVRAVAITDRPDQSIVLHIDQIQRTEVVRVHVRPAGGPADGPDGFHRLDEAVRAFLAGLDSRLGRRPTS